MGGKTYDYFDCFPKIQFVIKNASKGVDQEFQSTHEIFNKESPHGIKRFEIQYF